MNDTIAISVRNITKKFRLYDSPQQRLKEALHPLRKKYHREFEAIQDVSFDVKKGETLGILGRNGSGKSTLLQIICGILTPSSGSITTSGKISALLELGAGFNPEFTGRSNVYMNGALMGLSRDEIDAQMESIESFAEIGSFIDQPTKTYSSGMYVRLAFACAINVKPDILIVDEALSVGDIFFQQKCYGKIREIINSGTTCLFVSHDTQAVMQICNRAILLHDGKISFEGSSEEAVSRYYATMGKRAPAVDPSRIGVDEIVAPAGDVLSPADILDHSIIPPNIQRHGAGGVTVAAARVTDRDGKDTVEVRMTETLYFHILLRASQEIYDPSTGIHLYDRFGNLVFAAGTRQHKQRLPDLLPGQDLVVKMELTLDVQPGEYTFSLGASEPSDDGPNLAFAHDRLEMLGPILVSADHTKIFPFYGIARLPQKITFGTISETSKASASQSVDGQKPTTAARLTWMMTNWCNYACDYCGVTTFASRKRGHAQAHAFDHHPVEKWVEAFKKFPQKELYLKITGGEPFLDRKNFINLINALSDFDNILFIRIDTTGFWNPESFRPMRKEKLLLNMSYHPSQISFDKFLSNILQIRASGFNIPLINFVLSPDNCPMFEEALATLEQHGFIVNASAMAPAGAYAGRSQRDDEEITLIKKYAPPIDEKYKNGPVPTKGRLCLHPTKSYGLSYEGHVSVDCSGKKSNFFEEDLPLLPVDALPCPLETCIGCTEMYRELVDEPLATPVKGLYYLTDLADEIRKWRASAKTTKAVTVNCDHGAV